MNKDLIPEILTQQELDIMKVVCDYGAATVQTVFKAIHKGESSSYDSVMTAMKALKKRGFLVCTKQGQANCYKPVLSFQKIRAGHIRDVIDNYFDGDPRQFIDWVFENNYTGKDRLAIENLPATWESRLYENSGIWRQSMEVMAACN